MDGATVGAAGAGSSAPDVGEDPTEGGEVVDAPAGAAGDGLEGFVGDADGDAELVAETLGPAAQQGAATIGIRPEHIAVSPTEGSWQGRVGVSEHLGSDTFFHVEGTGIAETITVRASGELELYHGDRVFLTPDPARIHRFDDQGLRIG